MCSFATVWSPLMVSMTTWRMEIPCSWQALVAICTSSENKFEYIVILYLRNIASPPRTGHYSKLQVLCICQKQNSSSAHYLHGEELDFLVIDCDSGNFWLPCFHKILLTRVSCFIIVNVMLLCRAIRICQPPWDGPRPRWEDNLAMGRRSTRWWTDCCIFLSYSIQEKWFKRSKGPPSRPAWRGSWVSVPERARIVWWVNKTF